MFDSFVAGRRMVAGLRAILDTRLVPFRVPERMMFAAGPLPRLAAGEVGRILLKARPGR